jgi:ABC-type lipoprotein release transport system permease subunit
MASIALADSFLTALLLTDLFSGSQLNSGSIGIDSPQFWLVLVALVVMVVGVTNSMLISVYERYREIGTMKCIGALDQHILMLFIVESSIQGLSGGILGFILGLIAAILSTGFTIGFDSIQAVSTSTLIFAFLATTILSLLLSVVASIYPALRASRLDPVEALQYEL